MKIKQTSKKLKIIILINIILLEKIDIMNKIEEKLNNLINKMDSMNKIIDSEDVICKITEGFELLAILENRLQNIQPSCVSLDIDTINTYISYLEWDHSFGTTLDIIEKLSTAVNESQEQHLILENL